jgi:hypothetical protein
VVHHDAYARPKLKVEATHELLLAAQESARLLPLSTATKSIAEFHLSNDAKGFH